MGKSESVLVIAAVTEGSVFGEKRSTVIVRLLYPRKKTVPDIQEEYDLASLGEVDRIVGPYDNPLTWMVSYKGKVSARKVI